MKEDERNLIISTVDKRIVTNDEDANRILRSVEEELGSVIAAAMPAVVFDGEDPTTKVYLLLLKLYPYANNDVIDKDWCIKIGRQATYDHLKYLIKEEIIDPNQSFVLSGETSPEKAITVFRFMKVMYDEKKILDSKDDFDIEEYSSDEYRYYDEETHEYRDYTTLEV